MAFIAIRCPSLRA